jgi:type II restriction/modification system DNA methylase subunit YeeA
LRLFNGKNKISLFYFSAIKVRHAYHKRGFRLKSRSFFILVKNQQDIGQNGKDDLSISSTIFGKEKEKVNKRRFFDAVKICSNMMP